MFVWLAGVVGTFLASSVARFLAIKAVVYALMVTVLPVVLMNVLYSLMEKSITLINSAATGTPIQAQVLNLTGLSGWLAFHLRLPEAMAVVMAAVAFRFSLRLIPLIGR